MLKRGIRGFKKQEQGHKAVSAGAMTESQELPSLSS